MRTASRGGSVRTASRARASNHSYGYHEARARDHHVVNDDVTALDRTHVDDTAQRFRAQERPPWSISPNDVGNAQRDVAAHRFGGQWTSAQSIDDVTVCNRNLAVAAAVGCDCCCVDSRPNSPGKFARIDIGGVLHSNENIAPSLGRNPL